MKARIAARGNRWGWLRGAILEHRGRLVLATLAAIGDVALTLMRPWPVKVVIDRVIGGGHRPLRVPFMGRWLDSLALGRSTLLFLSCAAALSIGIGTGLLTYSYTRIMGDVARQLAFGLRRRLFGHLQRLSLRFHDNQRAGDLTVRLTTDIQAIQEMVANGVTLSLVNSLLLAGMGGLMVWLDWRFALVALSVSPLLFLVVFRYTHRIKVAARTARKSDGLLASLTHETLSSIRVVQGLGRENVQDQRFEAQNLQSLDASLDGIRYQARIAPLVDVLAGLGLCLVMWYGARRAAAGNVTTGDIVVFFAYVTNLYAPMRALARLDSSSARASIGAERVGDVLRIEQEVRDLPGAIPAPQLTGAIGFRDVTFGYDPARPVLKGISVQVSPGERIAIVGSSGAGKSTLVSLIPRLYDPGGGRIEADGLDIRGFQLASLREQISLVLQDSLLFSGTIADNIGFGRPSATLAEIESAARAAGADGFIRELPEGYDSAVGERGVTLSGGQRQRIAIARAILRDAPILILDEPTSALDMASERDLLDALGRAARGKTVFIVAHRLTTIELATRILVMDGGRIVEDGAPQDLARRAGPYSRLHGGTSHAPAPSSRAS
jgi:ATP-binding cassette subfamily B protein